MATDSPSHGSRRHFHRGRRGNDRRGPDRRGPQQQGQPQDQGARGDHLDVEQIMRDIRSRIAQRHGIDLTDQQVQELAARKLESILDPRSVKPSLLDQLRRSAGAPPDTVKGAERPEPPYIFEETTLYESPNGFMRFIRKLLNPLLKLLINPKPLIGALHIQSRFNMEAGRREAERDQRQAEWNALHYDILKRLVAEVAKVSLEMQSVALRVESLSAKVDFNERRVRGVEGALHQARPGGPRERERDRERDRDAVSQAPAPASGEAAAHAGTESGGPEAAAVTPGEAPRRRRRRRRGRRGGGGGAVDIAAPSGVEPNAAGAEPEGDELFEGPEPERITPQLEIAPEARESAASELPPAPPPEPDRDEPQ